MCAEGLKSLFSSHLGFSAPPSSVCLRATGGENRDWVSNEWVGQRGTWAKSRAFYVLTDLRRRLRQLEKTTNTFWCLFFPLTLCMSYFLPFFLFLHLVSLSTIPDSYWPSFFPPACLSWLTFLIALCSMLLPSYAPCCWCLNPHKRLLSWA